MYSIHESSKFQKAVEEIWTTEERLAFFAWLANNPLAGDVIPNSGGIRKVRWQASGKGKRGGARVIYYNVLDEGYILALSIYTKNEQENLPAHEMKNLKGNIP